MIRDRSNSLEDELPPSYSNSSMISWPWPMEGSHRDTDISVVIATNRSPPRHAQLLKQNKVEIKIIKSYKWDLVREETQLSGTNVDDESNSVGPHNWGVHITEISEIVCIMKIKATTLNPLKFWCFRKSDCVLFM